MKKSIATKIEQLLSSEEYFNNLDSPHPLHDSSKGRSIKKSIANKIEQLLAAMTNREVYFNNSDRDHFTGHPLCDKNIGKFCSRIPISIFNLIRSFRSFDLK